MTQSDQGVSLGSGEPGSCGVDPRTTGARAEVGRLVIADESHGWADRLPLPLTTGQVERLLRGIPHSAGVSPYEHEPARQSTIDGAEQAFRRFLRRA